MYVSLIIPTYNKLSRLKVMLSSIEMQTMPVNEYEVVLIDDCGDIDTNNYLKSKQWGFNLKYYRNKKQVGRSKARNIGVEKSTGDILVFTDDDCILARRFLEVHSKSYGKDRVNHGKIFNLPYLKFFSDPVQGILYPEFEDRKISSLSKMCINESDVKQNFEKISSLAKLTQFEKTVETCVNNEDSSLSWVATTGGNFSIDANLFKEVNGFDDNIGLNWGMEDLELGFRLYKKGTKFSYLNDAAVYHMAHYRTGSDDLSKKAIFYFENKHPEMKDVGLYDYFFSGKFDHALVRERIQKFDKSEIVEA